MKPFRFWQQWLLWSSLLIALLGILLAAGGNPVRGLYEKKLGELFFHASPDADVRNLFSFLSAPQGGTIACAYLLLAYLAWFPFRRKEKWARDAIILAFGTWLIVDSVACIRYGAWFQLYAINGISFLQKFLPLAFTWKDFGAEKKIEERS